MKKLLIPLLFLAATSMTWGQNVKLHFFANSSNHPYRFSTNLNPDKPIKIRSGEYAIIEINATQISLQPRDSQIEKNAEIKDLSLNFEPGKDYYFLVSKRADNFTNNIIEITENAFKLNLANYSLSPESVKHYILPNPNGELSKR